VFAVRQNLCCAFSVARTANKLFAVRFFLAHDKVFFSPYAHRINQVSFYQKYFVMRFNFGAHCRAFLL
jgi:hypothetical protein